MSTGLCVATTGLTSHLIWISVPVAGSSGGGDVNEVCECCLTADDVTFEPDPFASEIHDDDTPVWMCASCREQSAWDI